jgi:hypothetical protein
MNGRRRLLVSACGAALLAIPLAEAQRRKGAKGKKEEFTTLES